MKIENCPRCHKEWSGQIVIRDMPTLEMPWLPCNFCETCQVTCDAHNDPIAIRWRIKEELVVIWLIDEKQCGVCKVMKIGELYEADLSRPPLEMPLLPLDISEERLKLLMVFA